MSVMGPVAAILLLVASVSCYQQWRTIYQKITQEPEFSGFHSMIRNNRQAKLDLIYNPLTVFVPENAAVDDYDGEFLDSLVLYHMGVEVKTLKLLHWNNSLGTMYADNPPLWVTVTDHGYYVNNAKVVEDRSNYVAKVKGESNKNQVLHVVDQVLDPMVYSASHPTAHSFLSHTYKWKIGTLAASKFLHKIQLLGQDHLYQQSGGHTFFIPIDDKIDDYKWEAIDSYIIKGHVVPNIVLFTRPTKKNFIFETAANGDYIFIVLSLHTEGGKDYVKSYTIHGDTNHEKGELLTEIVKANIPVDNGVVHLIRQPLAVFDRDLKPFPYLPVFHKISADPDLSQAYNLGRKSKMNTILKVEKDKVLYTYFVPRDRAWGDYANYGRDELASILRKHVVVDDGRYSIAKLAMLTKNGEREINLNTLDGVVKLGVGQRDGSYFVVWKNRSIGVYRPDYECSNGIVHIIDGVFARAEVRDSRKGGFWRSLKDWVL